jgi:hypothetical protein
MRKIDPQDVKKEFAEQLKALSSFYSKGFKAFTSESDRSMLAEHSLLTAAVLWESFINDLLIAYINRDPTTFKMHLTNSFEAAVEKGKPKVIYDNYVKQVTFPMHLGKKTIEKLADQDGYNITFPDFRSLSKKVTNWLVPGHANKFTALSARQKATVDAVIALRNHIAHRSTISLDAMNAKLDVGALHGLGLRRGPNRIHNVGVWLKARPSVNSRMRFETIIRALDRIGGAL